MDRRGKGRQRDSGSDAVPREGARALPVYPTTHWAFTTWLSSASSAPGPAASGELVASMFRRMTSLVQSAIITVLLTTIATLHHPTPAFKAWLLLDAILVVARLSLVAAIRRFIDCGFGSGLPIADLYIVAGILWCLVLGCGAGLCIDSGDPGLGTLGAFLAMGTVGALAARNPGTPRITVLQMFLIVVPLATASALSAAPVVGWIVVLAPLYLVGMVSINRQLHEDFVELILGRIENRHFALHCPLTKLPNRTLFNQRLSQVVEGARTTDKQSFLLCLDLDGFKRVNDEHGHLGGDVVLIQVATRISVLLGADDIAARLGGDEFAIIVSAGDSQGAETVAKAVVSSLEKPFHLENNVVRIGVSIGLARAHRGTRDPSELLAQADLALYAAKNSGKSTFRWHEPPAGVGADLRAA